MSTPARVMVEVDGQILDLADCVWTTWAVCGCMEGACSTISRGEARFTEDAAWRFFANGNKREMEKLKREGFEMRLITREEYAQYQHGDCPHDPKWGMKP